MVAKVVNRMVFTKLVKVQKEFVNGEEHRHLEIPDANKFREWNEFLRVNSSLGEVGDMEDSPEEVEDLLNIGREEADKLLSPSFDIGLFKTTVDTEQNIRKLVCNDPEGLEKELKKLENLRSYVKMSELLKAMPSN